MFDARPSVHGESAQRTKKSNRVNIQLTDADIKRVREIEPDSELPKLAFKRAEKLAKIDSYISDPDAQMEQAQEMQRLLSVDDKLALPLSELVGIREVTLSALQKAQILTVKNFLSQQPHELLETKNFSEKGYKELVSYLSVIGIEKDLGMKFLSYEVMLARAQTYEYLKRSYNKGEFRDNRVGLVTIELSELYLSMNEKKGLREAGVKSLGDYITLFVEDMQMIEGFTFHHKKSVSTYEKLRQSLRFVGFDLPPATHLIRSKNLKSQLKALKGDYY